MAKVYLESTDTAFTVSNNNTTVYGASGDQVITIASGVTGVTYDQNTERVVFAGASSAYTYAQSGNQILVYSSGVLVATIPVQGDTNGTQLTFTNGTANAILTSGVMALGGTTVSGTSTTPAAVTPATIDTTVVSPTTTTTTVTGQAYTLTSSTTADVITGTSANDTVTGAVGTLGASDVIVDASKTDSDKLDISMNSYASTQATITNIETINATGVYASTGFDAANTTATQTLNLTAGLAGATATADGITATKVAKVVAGSNVGTLKVNTTAAMTTGTGGAITVDAGSATTITLGHTGNTGSDTYTLTAPTLSTITLSGGSGGTDTATLNLSGGATTLAIANSVAATADMNVLNINSNTSANTITLSDTTHELTSSGSSDLITFGGTQNVTLKGDGDVFSGTSATNGSAMTKATGAGTVTLESNGALGAAAFFNRAVVDYLNLTTTATTANITINENTTLKMSVANGSQTYDVGTYSTAGTLAAGAGTLKMDLTGTSSTNATQTSITTGAAVGTLVISNNTIDSTITTLDTNTTAGTVDTTVISGSKNLTIGTWTATALELLTASTLSGNLTLTVGANGASVVGGTGNDTITGGGAADSINGGSGNDVLNGGAFADTMTGGTGNDRFVLKNSATIDTVTDFSISGTNGIDVISFAAGDTTTFVTGALSAIKDGSAAAVSGGTTAKVLHLTGATTAAAGDNVFVVDGTFSSSSALEIAIEASGTRQLTLASAPTANDDILVVWTDGTNGHVGYYNLAAIATTPTFAGTYTELATLTGIADVSSMASANFLFQS